MSWVISLLQGPIKDKGGNKRSFMGKISLFPPISRNYERKAKPWICNKKTSRDDASEVLFVSVRQIVPDLNENFRRKMKSDYRIFGYIFSIIVLKNLKFCQIMHL